MSDGSTGEARCGVAAELGALAARAAAEFELGDTHCYICILPDEASLLASLSGAGLARVHYFQCRGRHYALCLPTSICEAECDRDPLECMTPREQQIVRLVCVGCVNKQIAYRLRISEYTVKTYLKQMFVKLGVHSRSALVYRCAPSLGAVAPGSSLVEKFHDRDGGVSRRDSVRR